MGDLPQNKPRTFPVGDAPLIGQRHCPLRRRPDDYIVGNLPTKSNNRARVKVPSRSSLFIASKTAGSP
jgi:hypothetical protein